MIGFSDLKEFYKGRRVFVSGHNGFKGSWLTLLLEELGTLQHPVPYAPCLLF